MKYICQIQDGLMLVQLDDRSICIENTGYPYRDTEKSNYEMLQDLFMLELSEDKSIDWVRSRYPQLRTYLLSCWQFSKVPNIEELFSAMKSSDRNIESKVAHDKYEETWRLNVLERGRVYKYLFEDSCYIYVLSDVNAIKGKIGVEVRKRCRDAWGARGYLDADKVYIAFHHINLEVFAGIEESCVCVGFDNVERVTLHYMFDKYTEFGFLFLPAILLFVGVNTLSKSCFELNSTGMREFNDAIRKTNTIHGNFHFSNGWSRVLSSYVKSTYDLSISDVCDFVNSVTSNLLTKEEQEKVLTSPIIHDSFYITDSVFKDKSIDIDVDRYIRCLKLAAEKHYSISRSVRLDKFTKDILEKTYEGVLYAFARITAKNIVICWDKHCSFEIKRPMLAKLYTGSERFRELMNIEMNGLKPTLSQADNMIQYEFANMMDISISEYVALSYYLKYSLSTKYKNSVLTLLRNDLTYDSSKEVIMTLFNGDIARLLVMGGTILDDLSASFADMLEARNLNLRCDVRNYLGTSLSVFEYIFINYADVLFKRDVEWTVTDTEYIYEYTFCLIFGEDDIKRTSVDKDFINKIKKILISDFLACLIIEQKVFLKGLSFLYYDNVYVSFDYDDQRISLSYDFGE